MVEDDERHERQPPQAAGRDDHVQAIARDIAETEAGNGPPAAASAMDSVAALFARHHGAVLRAAHRVTGSAADAEDVLQTVFMRLLRRPAGPGDDRLDLSQSAAGYLHRAAVNAALDLLRSRRRSRLVAFGDVEREPVDDRHPDPERRFGHRELGRRLRAAMARLSPRQAEIFALRYLEGMGNLEIARLLGSSQTAIAVVLHRARRRLQRELRSPQGEGERS
jgi:RNA polymerase sigma-70 factor (ECF subfamily)